MSMETSSAPTMTATIPGKVSGWCISSKVLTLDGEAIGNMENIQILKIIHTRCGWMRACISRVGRDKLRTLFLQSLISTTVRPEWCIIPGLRWVQHGRTNFFLLNLWVIRVALTYGPLA